MIGLMKMGIARVSCAGLACTALGACGAQQWYGAGQQWQRNQCQKIDDRAEHTRCEGSVAPSFQDYQAQRQGRAKP
jgi:hypothetical protein